MEQTPPSHIQEGHARPKTGRPPSQIDEPLLARLVAEGQTQRAIAPQLGVTPRVIERAVARLGLQSSRKGPRSGRLHHQRWSDGRSLDKHGYVLIWAPLHPNARDSGYMSEHRLVAEVMLGRYLDQLEVVHHRDDHPRHNWPDNLETFATNADHLRSELSDLPQASRRRSIDGAYGNTQRLRRCPDESETLAQCPSEIRLKLERHIEIHRPTSAHRTMARREFLRLGAHQTPFAERSAE